jgi:integrase
MTRPEYEELPHLAETDLQEIAIRLMGDCGLRVGEVLDVTVDHISRMTDGRHYELEVVGGKDTTGEYDIGKQRETWIPRQLEQQIMRYTNREEIGDGEPVVDRSLRTVKYWVEEAAAAAAEETGNDDYLRVSSHDLRRCWAHYLLVEEGVSPRIVMSLGGWSSYDAIEPYLAAPSEKNIIDTMTDVDL